MHKTNVARFLAVLLAVGGVAGIGVSAWMGYTFVQTHWIYILFAGALAALFVWSVNAGVRLWRGEPKGWKWATILFALQVPILTVPGLSYEFFTGLAVKIVGGGPELNFAFNFGANANFYLSTETTGLLYGVNVVAILALIYLLRNRPGKVMQPAQQSSVADA